MSNAKPIFRINNVTIFNRIWILILSRNSNNGAKIKKLIEVAKNYYNSKKICFAFKWIVNLIPNKIKITYNIIHIKHLINVFSLKYFHFLN
jgi:hypothetical protein